MLVDYLPQFMQDIDEMKKIMDISQPEIDKINENLENILKDFFVLEASEQGVEHYEKMLDIMPKFTDSLEKRRYDILSIYNQVLPFTLETLKEKLNALCGENGYTINLIYDKFILSIRLNLDKRYFLNTVESFLENIVPLNLIIELSIDYNIWKDLYKHKWVNIKKYKWNEIKEKEEIKTVL